MLLSENELALIPWLRNILGDAAERQRDVERLAVVEAPIVAARVRELVDEMATEFERAGLGVELFGSVGAIDYPGETVGGVELSLDRLDHKDPFVEHSRFISIDWGRQYGRGLAASEDKAVFAEMLRRAPADQSDVSSGDDDFAKVVEQLLEKAKKRSSQLVIIALNPTKSPSVPNRVRTVQIPQARQLRRSESGRFDGVPVYQHYDPDGGDQALIVADLRRYGSFANSPPSGSGQTKRGLGGPALWVFRLQLSPVTRMQSGSLASSLISMRMKRIPRNGSCGFEKR